MTASEGYGQRLAERLRAEQAHAIVTRVLRTADMAVTETRCDDPVLGLSHSIQREDAYLVALTLRDFPNRQYWEDGRQMPVCDLRTGQVDFHDLKRDPVALLDKPYHDLFFYLPRCALDAIADDADAPRIGDLNHKPVAIDDSHDFQSREDGAAGAQPSRPSEPVVRRPRTLGARGTCCSDLWRHATSVAAGPGWARAMASEARQGNSQRQSRWSCAAQGGGSGVPLVGEPFLARVSPHHGSSTAQLASDASHRGGQGEAARSPIVAVGCGPGLRLCRSKPPDPSLHPHGRRKSRRLASRARRLAKAAIWLSSLSPDYLPATALIATAGHGFGRRRVTVIPYQLRRLASPDPLSQGVMGETFTAFACAVDRIQEGWLSTARVRGHGRCKLSN